MKHWSLVVLCVLTLTAGLWAQENLTKVAEVSARQAALEKVQPEYPVLAKQMKLTGRVEIEALIDAEGNVEKTQVVTGNPLLSSAATAALKKWKFTPFTSDGKPTRVSTTISFDFRL